MTFDQAMSFIFKVEGGTGAAGLVFIRAVKMGF